MREYIHFESHACVILWTDDDEIPKGQSTFLGSNWLYRVRFEDNYTMFIDGNHDATVWMPTRGGGNMVITWANIPPWSHVTFSDHKRPATKNISMVGQMILERMHSRYLGVVSAKRDVVGRKVTL